MTGDDDTVWKVGELARASHLSVRALRYYDQIGLLAPSRRTSAGHRVYHAADVSRLYRICLLRRVGMALSDIARALDEPTWQLRRALPEHVQMLDHQIAAGTAARHRVAALAAAIEAEPAPSTAQLLKAMADLTMLEAAVQRRIAILVYDDIETMQAWLARVFGFDAGPLAHDGDGRCVHGEVHAGDGVIWLHQVSPGFGLNSPQALGAATGTTAIMVDDVDAHHRRVVAQGAEILYEPVDMAYGYREYSARDPEDGLWSFMKPR